MIKRIPELLYNGIVPSNAKIPWYDPSTDTTYHLDADDILSGLSDPGDAWNEFFPYALGDLVTYGGQVWVSEANANTGNPPGPASTFWDVEPDPPALGGLTMVVLDTTTSGTVVMNLAGNKELCFKGSDPITENKVWSFVNQTQMLLIPFCRFTISGGLYVQTLPVGSRLAGAGNADWNSVTRQWTPLSEGDYEARVTYDQSQFWWGIQGPY